MKTKRQPIKPEQKEEVIKRYKNLETMISIAKSLDMTRQGVFKILKKAGVDTSKSQRVAVVCSTCGKTVEKMKSRVRGKNQFFCSKECHLIWLDTLGEGYKPSSYYSRMGRKKVTEYFDYKPEDGQILHHINKDCSDNRKINLMVFASQGDHVRYHRGIQVTPIWDGRIQ